MIHLPSPTLSGCRSSSALSPLLHNSLCSHSTFISSLIFFPFFPFQLYFIFLIIIIISSLLFLALTTHTFPHHRSLCFTLLNGVRFLLLSDSSPGPLLNFFLVVFSSLRVHLSSSQGVSSDPYPSLNFFSYYVTPLSLHSVVSDLLLRFFLLG